MDAVQQEMNTLPQARWPVLDKERGRATVALTRGVDGLGRVRDSKDDALSSLERRLDTACDVRRDDVRLDKVERLRAAIADGTYCVSADALADRMIEHMREVDTLPSYKDES